MDKFGARDSALSKGTSKRIWAELYRVLDCSAFHIAGGSPWRYETRARAHALTPARSPLPLLFPPPR